MYSRGFFFLILFFYFGLDFSKYIYDQPKPTDTLYIYILCGIHNEVISILCGIHNEVNPFSYQIAFLFSSLMVQ